LSVLGPASGATLLFFTESYPYDIAVEQTFIEPQLGYLRDAFERVVVIPARRGGRRLVVPEGIDVDDSLAAVYGSTSRLFVLLRAWRSQLFWREIVGRPVLLTSPKALKLLARLTGRAEIATRWLSEFMARRDLSPKRVIAYTFWCDQVTVGLALFKARRPELVMVSRINGYDFLEGSEGLPYFPCRRFTLRHLDRMFAVSEFARQYEVQRYPWFAPRCEVSRLGVPDPGFLARGSSEGRFVVVSCSGIIPRKRVHLILGGIDVAARRNPGLILEWHHFGDGDTAEELNREAGRTLPRNAQAVFHGHQPIGAIMSFYRLETADVFVNASRAEGGVPVAIQEAASVGLPIIAADVGGIPEIVSEDNGRLLGPDPTPTEIGGAISDLIARPDRKAVQRAGSRKVWRAKFSADSNYVEFARKLVQLRW
jgi:glycosyltransferase involved in cell wall biosynthesis